MQQVSQPNIGRQTGSTDNTKATNTNETNGHARRQRMCIERINTSHIGPAGNRQASTRQLIHSQARARNRQAHVLHASAGNACSL
eukprot:7208497-Alexandrium_andersonii.AAC.1